MIFFFFTFNILTSPYFVRILGAALDPVFSSSKMFGSQMFWLDPKYHFTLAFKLHYKEMYEL